MEAGWLREGGSGEEFQCEQGIVDPGVGGEDAGKEGRVGIVWELN